MLNVINANGERARKAAYVDLLKITGKALGYARNTVKIIKSRVVAPGCIALLADIEHYAQLTVKVIDQTHRRVVLGQKVAAADKVVSIFEPHCDVIIKDRRDPVFGHKIRLTGGASNLILDGLIVQGNPADVDLAIPMLNRQKESMAAIHSRSALTAGS
jgi:IS5 family transposase